MNSVHTLAASPLLHVVDKPLISGELFGMEIWWLSNAMVMLVIGAIVTGLLVIPAAKRIQTGQSRSIDDFRAQGLLANMVESVCLYLRDEVFRGVLHDQTDRYTPMLWTLFWFILVCNLLGLVPLLDGTYALSKLIFGAEQVKEWHFHGIGGTATQSIWVTGALALVAAIFYMGTALLKDPVGFAKHLTGGAPWFMWPIMIPVELMGYAIKPFALAIRLFANMTGGHLILAVLFSFVPAAFAALGTGAGSPVALVAMIGAVGVNLLEILVALIQAYIFTFLTCLFLGQLIVHEHDEHDEHEHEVAGGQVDPHTALAKQDVPVGETAVAGSH
jgi:F-type H+-transporting ATPase subunit a